MCKYFEKQFYVKQHKKLSNVQQGKKILADYFISKLKAK
jgi:hypothetical protein